MKSIAIRLFVLTLVMFTFVVFAKDDTRAAELHTSVVIYSPVPGLDREAQCVLTNVSNSTLDVEVQINSPLGSSPFTPVTLDPGEFSGVVRSISDSTARSAYCSFRFNGSADKIRGLIRVVDGVGTGGDLVVLERAEAR